MKTYRRRFAQTALKRNSDRRIEQRDAILWSIDEDNRQCRVRIQGSGKLITAHYHRTRKDIPEFMRIGSAVKLAHVKGNRGYIEIVGSGRAIPAPTTGGALPDPGDVSDTRITGMIPTQATVPGNYVFITAGTYRLDGVNYAYDGYPGDYIVMSDPAPMTMGAGVSAGSGILMAQIYYYVGAPPEDISGQIAYRYDAIVVDAYGDTTTIQGVAATSDPQYPTIPSGYLLINYILRTSGEGSVITNYRIGEVWTEPYPAGIVCSHTAQMSTCTFDCDGTPVSGEVPQAFFTFYMIDQYGDLFTPASGDEYTVTLNMYTYAKGDIELGTHEYNYPTTWEPVLPHEPEELTTTFTLINPQRTFTYSGEAGVNFMFAVTNATVNLLGSDSFVSADIEDYDWTYPYDDDNSVTGDYQCL